MVWTDIHGGRHLLISLRNTWKRTIRYEWNIIKQVKILEALVYLVEEIAMKNYIRSYRQEPYRFMMIVQHYNRGE
jgi:hypothetical protein